MDAELPDDMQDLLDELDSVEAVTHELEAPGIPIAEAAKAIPAESSDDLLDELEDAAAPPAGVALRPVDERNMDAYLDKPTGATAASVPIQGFTIDIEKYKQQLDGVTSEVLDANRNDRQEVQEVINTLRDLVVSTGPTKAVIDGLVQALAVKTNIHTNSIRIMETNTKFITAAKSQIKVEQKFNVSGAELSDILDGVIVEGEA